MMTFQTRSRSFLARHRLSHTPQIHALDLVSEVGEVAKALLEGSNYGESAPRSTLALEEELGDAFFSLIALAESLDVDLETALEKALAKYENRLIEKSHCGSQDELAGKME
jgi:NTP pyrophosphatase (non-canonical NTP hydrolase)